MHEDPQVNFLWKVLKLTIKYPQVESYLKNLLNHFTVDKLENVFNNWSILHYMCRYPSNISLNAFEIIINHGVNVNKKSKYGSTTAHQLFCKQCSAHVYNILNLLIKYNINLNIMNLYGDTVLDVLTLNGLNELNELNEVTKNCIMTIIDFGEITNNTYINNAVYDFIEYYKCSSIKPAIKNENKI